MSVRRGARVVGGSILVLALLVVGARAISRRYLFPSRELARLDSPPDLVARAIRARDGREVHVLELPPKEGARTIVHFHNNRETIEACAGLARSLHALGFGVLLVEYRGYGNSSELDANEDGFYLDAEAALDMLAARGVGPDRIVLSGTSLGTGVAAEMARRGRGSRLVLMTPYTSIPDVVEDHAPGTPASLLVADHFDTLSKVDEIRIPTLVVHGDADEIVPFWMGERLAQSIGGAKLIRVSGGHHGDLWALDHDEILAAIKTLGES